ncbi:MAG: NAD(P)H:quinone oxidoreductase [Candidatus Krumholzibacteriota bacterium]|nr:NAD(P)H:quinone oxidoreductase [Candidatus Krumholzibacteriota bacterium]
MKVLVLYYSMYGHIYKLAQAAAEGAGSVEGVESVIRRVPETLSDDLIAQMGAAEAQKAQADVPICTVEEMGEADAVIFCTPTRFGNMCGQMRQFLDATGPLWAKGALVGKAGSVITSSGTQHGGQESTILTCHITLLHHGMVIVGLPYAFQEQTKTDSVIGCSPYGASTIAGSDGSRKPCETDILGARFQGAHVARIARKLSA